MPIPRVSLLELNDASWVPRPLKETIIEALSRTLRWGGVVRGLVPSFEAFLHEADTDQILDIASGAGGPAAILAEELAKVGRHVRFTLTDLQPRPDVWDGLAARDPEHLTYVVEPVDATRISPELGAGKARVIINAFHHFPPDLAAAVLRGAAEGAPGVFIAESFERNPLGFVPMTFAGLPSLLATPALTPHGRASKIALTWLTPAAVLASVFDGVVSTLRVYNEAELREMVAPLGDALRWTYGNFTFPMGGRGYYFYGVRQR